jgi:Flp pilus assembly protein TadD
MLDPILAAYPGNVTARNVKAFAAVRRGQFDEAERQYRASLVHQPNQHRVYGALGGLALRRGDLDQAERLLHEALEIAPTYVEAMSNLGFIAVVRGDQQTAESWYRQAIALDPAYPHVHRRLADLFYDRGDWERAAEYYGRVLSMLPHHFEALIQAGNVARFRNDPSEATRFYETAGRERPDSWIPPYNLACLRALAGDTSSAMTLLGRAVDLGCRSPQLLEGNEDFSSLHGLPEWPALVARAGAPAPSRTH